MARILLANRAKVKYVAQKEIYLSADGLHVLSNAYRNRGYHHATKLFSKPHLRVQDVQALYEQGFLSKRGERFAANDSTLKVLQDHGWDLSLVEIQEKAKPEPKLKAEEKFAARLIEADLDEMVGMEPGELKALVQAVTNTKLEECRQRCRDGDPFPLIRMQWPELVIKDADMLWHFKRLCSRDHDLDLRLDDKACKFLKWAFDPTMREMAIKGCTSAGKGHGTSLFINLWYDIWQEDRIVLISETSTHAKDVMFAEVATWRRLMKHPCKGEILREGIKDPGVEKHNLVIANPQTGEGLSGRHGGHTLFVFDEASSTPEFLYKNARQPARMVIAISNPRVLSGWFYNLFPKLNPNDDQIINDRGIRRGLVTFGGPDCLNVQGQRLKDPIYSPPDGLKITTPDGEYEFPEGVEIPKELRKHARELIPGQMDIEKFRTTMQDTDKTKVAWAGLGHFPPEDLEFQIIPPSWLDKPVQAWNLRHSEIVVSAFGLDLAASDDGDECSLTPGGWKGLLKPLTIRKKMTNEEALTWVRNGAASCGVNLFDGSCPIAVDAIGAGGDRFCGILESAGATVIRCIGNASSDANPHVYMNKRTELYGELASRLSPDSDELDVFMIPDDHSLHEEFVAHEKIYATDGIRFRLTPKKKEAGSKVMTIKDKIGRSPDRADSAVLCFAAIQESAESGCLTNQFDPRTVATEIKKSDDGVERRFNALGEPASEDAEYTSLEDEKNLWLKSAEQFQEQSD